MQGGHCLAGRGKMGLSNTEQSWLRAGSPHSPSSSPSSSVPPAIGASRQLPALQGTKARSCQGFACKMFRGLNEQGIPLLAAPPNTSRSGGSWCWLRVPSEPAGPSWGCLVPSVPKGGIHSIAQGTRGQD